MHYLELVSSVDPRGGGVIAGITALANERASQGDLTTVASLDAPDAFPAQSFPYTWVGLGPGRGTFAYAQAYTPWLRQHAGKFDAVIINGLWQYHSFGAWRALTAMGIPYLVFPHGMLDPWFKRQYPLKHLKKMIYWWWADYRVLRDATAVCFTSDQERRLATQSFRPYHVQEQVVGYGIDDPPPPDADQVQAFHHLVPEAAGKRILLFLSRIHEKKGCDLLLAAFAIACAHDPRWHLVMAGPDQDGCLARLQARASVLGIGARVSWPGMVTGAAKWGAFRSAEVFCLPSHQENFGVVIAESLACGCPVLISDQVNIWREVVDCHAGLAGKDTVAGITEILMRWVALAEEDALSYRRQARSAYLQHFHVAAAAARLRAVIDESVVPA
jgi:glycosyltransferase involved in cell wall biosynthesis